MNLGLFLVCIGVAGMGLSGVPALLFNRHANAGQGVSFGLNVLSSLCGIIGLAIWFSMGNPIATEIPWKIPGGSIALGLDGLSAFFLIPVFLVSAMGALFGLEYWKQSEKPKNGNYLRLFYGLLSGGMGWLLLARNSVLFLLGWEIMAVAAYFLIVVEDEEKKVRQAGWIYWVSTHFGMAALIILFMMMHDLLGTFNWSALPLKPSEDFRCSALFLLAVLGFGFKAGIMPFHFWLPKAHSSAPSHVSGMMSGVMLKMGIYGMIRILGYLSQPPAWWGILVLVMGIASGVLGIILAIGESDLKRMLAFSSIENIGIIFMGLGLALIGRSSGNDILVQLGMMAALFHVLNHSLFKTTLFYCSGSILHAAHTRRMDWLGGLIPILPVTGGAFVLASCAACGLPPLNGFIGEWILYQGFFHLSANGSFFPTLLGALAIGGLGLIGSLSVVCFVRAFGIIFLGSPRFSLPLHGKEKKSFMAASLTLLLAACLGLSFLPGRIVFILGKAMESWETELSPVHTPLDNLVSLKTIAALNISLFIVLGAGMGWLLLRKKTSGLEQPDQLETWSCGYLNPVSPRFQYTASSFGEILSKTYHWVVPFKFHGPSLGGFFPRKSGFSTITYDRILGGILIPAIRLWVDKVSVLLKIQQGRTSIYILYILIAFVIALCWGSWSLR
jgi:hydrogenase-4 component B